jgi:hypothetical protein
MTYQRSLGSTKRKTSQSVGVTHIEDDERLLKIGKI